MKLPGLLAAASKLATLTAEPYAERLKALAPARETVNAGTAIARLRMKKSEREIRLLERAAQITLEAHRAAWRRMVPGLFEYQVAAAMSNVYFDAGCERHAYAPIVGSGPNAAILHYSANSRRMDEGELLLMDVGAECSGYAADVTRTVPVSGRFTPRQREIYDMVLGAQNAVLAALKPGMTLGKDTPNSLHRVAVEYFDRFQDKDGNPMSRYFTHGLGHPVGLDVHDAHDPALPLAEGMVVTVEPGLYLPGEGIGVRIEDMVLVTASGAKLMSGGLPREADQIEAALAARK
jgi:Xaa-Pro aminopeptidase